MTNQICINCSTEYTISETVYSCRKCGHLIEIKLDIEKTKEKVRSKLWRETPLSVWRYKLFIPIAHKTPPISLEEGGTNLLRADNLERELKIRRLYVKVEGENPTGSFKDRGMTVGVTRAKELKARTVLCASTGNTSASLAAYAARAGLRCNVLVPSGKVASGKLTQTLIYGAKLTEVKGSFDDALRSVLQMAEKRRDIYLLNSVNPFRIEGQKTAAYEIVEQLRGEVPDSVVVPVGNAGNISAIWKGFKEFFEIGFTKRLPRMIGVQAEGAAPIADAVMRRKRRITPLRRPNTVASAIRIGFPASWKKALDAIYQSKGTAVKVSDEEILQAQAKLARTEGLFVEPASAASLAGLHKLLDLGSIENDEVIVIIATGHGLKDPEIVLKRAQPVKTIGPDADLSSILPRI